MWIKQVLFGQCVALCLGGIGIFSKLLAMNGFNCSSLQVIIGYLLMSTLCLKVQPWKNGLSVEWWKYLILAIIDFNANFMYSSAFRYTAATSVRMMIGFTVPGAVLLGYLVFDRRVTQLQLLAVIVAVSGLALNVTSDFINDPRANNAPSDRPWVGNILAFSAALFFSVSNIIEEWIQKKIHSPDRVHAKPDTLELVCMLGVFGALVGDIESRFVEWNMVEKTIMANHSWKVWLYVLGFSISMCMFYVGLSLFLSKHDASFLNLSMLTVSIDILVFESIYLKRFRAHDWMYALAFLLSLSGTAYFYSISYFNKKNTHVLKGPIQPSHE